jgi:enolase
MGINRNMTDFKISKIKSRWILDSRGNPTVETDIFVGKQFARAAVPSGASTGVLEALELRDGGPAFLGKHVTKAVANVNDIIGKKVIGFDARNQTEIDNFMINLDGTENKRSLGANAILSVSLGCAKIAAQLLNKPLFEYLYELSHHKSCNEFLMPIPSCNIINGGKHAGNQLAIQEFMILPLGAGSFSKAIQGVSEVYHVLKEILEEKYGKQAINVGDEGGFAPNLSQTDEAINVIVNAIEKAGYAIEKDFIIGMDAAASEFYDGKGYKIDGKNLSSSDLLDYYLSLIEEHPYLKSIEDPFDEKAMQDFARISAELGQSVQIVDDDLTVTNIKILQKAIDLKAGNALLLKVNQIGTLTESIEACQLAFRNGFNVMVSHRSGETSDNFIADLAVGLCTGQLKSGAPCRGERTSKYNQLLRIEEMLGNRAKYPSKLNSWKAFQ